MTITTEEMENGKAFAPDVSLAGRLQFYLDRRRTLLYLTPEYSEYPLERTEARIASIRSRMAQMSEKHWSAERSLT